MRLRSQQKVGRVLFGWATTALLSCLVAHSAPNLILWDTGSPLRDPVKLAERTAWQPVPLDLFILEADPPKASSDPGYYGKEYTFKGDAVVENRHCLALFRNETGQVLFYAKDEAAGSPRLLTRLVPLRPQMQPSRVHRCRILRHTEDSVVLTFSDPETAGEHVTFTFDRTQILEIQPDAALRGFRLLGPVQYGIVPDLIGDDLIFGPSQFAAAERLVIPAENAFLALLPGEQSEMLLTWPPGKQRLSMVVEPGKSTADQADSIELETGGQSFYLAPLLAPGIWHQEPLTAAFLEKDRGIGWTPPFPARWQTQLNEAGLRTTFAFRQTKGQIWRGVPGSYIYPVWIEGEKVFFHLSKKIPPKGEALIYYLEGQGTPENIATPAALIKATLGRSVANTILDPAGRKLRTHHRRGEAGVHRACTCGCTDVIQAVFEAGQETQQRDEIREALDDMMFFVECHVARIDEYRHFADELIHYLQNTRATEPGLDIYLDPLEAIVQQIPQEYSVQKENMKSLDHAGELARQTLALTDQAGPDNLKKYMELLKAWRAMGGAQDYVLARYHGIVRKLAQQAGYGCAGQPQAVEMAQEIRGRCRQCLRNPDGYEIWTDY